MCAGAARLQVQGSMQAWELGTHESHSREEGQQGGVGVAYRRAARVQQARPLPPRLHHAGKPHGAAGCRPPCRSLPLTHAAG